MPEFWLPYISALIVGLLGGVHCLGMCGGIVSSLSMGMSPQHQKGPLSALPLQLSYNFGRISSYVFAGAIMGGLGSLLLQWLPIYSAQRILLLFAGLFMILLGCYIGGWWMALNRVEKAGGVIWKVLEPLGRRFLPIQSPLQAVGLGLIWGWLPCGLVYSMLINAVAGGSMVNGAGIMLAFAIGTLPNLLLMGFLVGAASHILHAPLTRKIAGGCIIGFGIWSLFRVYLLSTS